MKTISISFEVTEQQIEIFAKSKGWKRTVFDEKEEPVDNPVSAEEYVINYCATTLRDEMALALFVEQVKPLEEQKRLAQEQIKAAVESKIEVDIV